ncbi:MAG: hypothetical protein PHU80_05170 [Kiritimatiellae bacterium]|nr:hypothetical protein [Kiritimatiellia bacterium]
MPLHCWSYLLGLICLVIGISIAWAPARMSAIYKALPRNKAAGYILSTIAWIWAGVALMTMGLDLLMPFQKYIPFAVLACIPLTWLWLGNLLSCRAIGAILTLFPYELLHVARVHTSPWRLVLVTLAYLCIVKGMILLLYPWKMRQAIDWLNGHLSVFRLAGVAHALLGALLIALGATVLR